MTVKNVFVPLTTEAFNDFSRGKTFEIRKAERGWNRQQLFTGRGVTLSHGYSGQRKFGIIGKVIFGSLKDIFSKIEFKIIEPTTQNRTEAIMANQDLLGLSAEYVAFEIILNEK